MIRGAPPTSSLRLTWERWTLTRPVPGSKSRPQNLAPENLRRGHSARALHQSGQELKLEIGQSYGPAAPMDLPGPEIHLDIYELKHPPPTHLATALQSPKVCHQHVATEGFGEIAVGSGSETVDDVFFVASAREHLDQCEIAGGAQPLGHLEAFDVGEVHIQNDDIVRALPRQSQPLRAGGRMITLGAGLA